MLAMWIAVIERKECVAADGDVMDSAVCTFVQIPTSPSGMKTMLMGTNRKKLTLDFEIQPCLPACLSWLPLACIVACPLRLSAYLTRCLLHTRLNGTSVELCDQKTRTTYVKWAFVCLFVGLPL